MKIKEDVNMIEFLISVKKCSEEVMFETNEGDTLNLKSILSQYVISLVDAQDELIRNGVLVCSEQDYEILSAYLENREG